MGYKYFTEKLTFLNNITFFYKARSPVCPAWGGKVLAGLFFPAGMSGLSLSLGCDDGLGGWSALENKK